MDLGIAGKIALITGGSKGIGRGIAHRLAQEDCRIIVAAREKKSIDETVGEIRSRGGEAQGISADCTSLDGISACIAMANERFGGHIEIAVYNVKAGAWGGFDDVSEQDFQAAHNNLVLGFARFVRLLAPAMKERGWGRLVTVSSMNVTHPHREQPLVVQDAARLGALALSKVLANDLGPCGITVNSLATGMIETDNFKNYFTQRAALEGISYNQLKGQRTATIPMRRLGLPEDMADLCAFLCSTLSGYITGQAILVDGGLVEGY